MEENVENVTDDVTKLDMSQAVEQPVDDGVTKLDLNKPEKPVEENEVKENNPDNEGVVTELDNAESTEKQEEVQPEEQAQEETPVLEEITEEEVQEQTEELTEQVEEAVAKAQETGKALPENVQKLMDFMDETGGTLKITYVLTKIFLVMTI